MHCSAVGAKARPKAEGSGHLSQAFLYILLDISFVQIVISNRYPQSHWARPTLLWGAPGYSQKCWARPKNICVGRTHLIGCAAISVHYFQLPCL